MEGPPTFYIVSGTGSPPTAEEMQNIILDAIDLAMQQEAVTAPATGSCGHTHSNVTGTTHLVHPAPTVPVQAPTVPTQAPTVSTPAVPTPVPVAKPVPTVPVTIKAGTTMNTFTSYNGANVVRPVADQGQVRLAQDLPTTLPFGTQFRTTSGPHGCTWTIGPIGTEVRPRSGVVDVPAQIKIVDLEFKSKRTVLTEVSEKYVLQEDITVTLSNTVVHCELVEAYISKDSTKAWTVVIQ